MAFKLTYSDGQESQHDDDTVWELDDGVLKLGRTEGKWSVLLSPSHWAVLELVSSSDGDGDSKDESEKDDSDEKSDRSDKSDDKDDKSAKSDDEDDKDDDKSAKDDKDKKDD
ncbi:hypothetical protein FHR72_002401 [Mycolicibacterium iranicum]|uniref:Uncharacterized protein n=1 Tax=Mycolicibacterium iranicum TaxID=912594 RepID=A0A839Q3U3_MYCIR|nr:hypothetical protein [Mycolicibacterium iranicum]MBB2990928.1 hypothetical protein [Mycolicibacterium iranicum]